MSSLADSLPELSNLENPIIIDMSDRGYHQIVSLLVDLDADLNVRDKRKGSIIKIAYEKKDGELMKILSQNIKPH